MTASKQQIADAKLRQVRPSQTVDRHEVGRVRPGPSETVGVSFPYKGDGSEYEQASNNSFRSHTVRGGPGRTALPASRHRR
jgi:hypothetical protein